MQMESRAGMAIAQKVARLRRETLVWLHNLSRLLTTHRALIPGAAAGYAVLFGFVIYGLAVHARLELWREPSVPVAAAQTLAPAAHAVAAACAEFAGMGQTPCNVERKIEVACADSSPRFAVPRLRDIQPPVERAKPAPHPPTAIVLAAEAYPDGGDEDQPLSQDEPPNLSLAYRE